MKKLSESAAAGLLTIADIASMLKLSPSSVRTYHTDSTRRRRLKVSLLQDMPAPDLTIARTPVWSTATVEQWQSEREAAADRNIERLRAPRGSRVKPGQDLAPNHPVFTGGDA